MTKAELVLSVAKKASLAKVDAQAAIDALVEVIQESLKENGVINLSGLGSFSTAIRPARSARNPRTGEAIELKETKIVKFKVSKSLKEEVANSK